MSFTLPTFNTTVNLWRQVGVYTGPFPPGGLPALTFQCNFGAGRRGVQWGTELEGSSYVLAPIDTQIQDGIGVTGSRGGDILEIPAGSGRFYQCFWADQTALGFSNEHVVAQVCKSNGFSSGMPAFISPPIGPPAAAAILMEGTGYVLLESGFKVLME